VKMTLAPVLFAGLFLYLGWTVPGHLAFYGLDSFGWFCTESARSQGMARGEKREIRFQVDNFCSPTGISLEERGRYRLTDVTVRQCPLRVVEPTCLAAKGEVASDPKRTLGSLRVAPRLRDAVIIYSTRATNAGSRFGACDPKSDKKTIT
jgi:hypothetical protein